MILTWTRFCILIAGCYAFGMFGGFQVAKISYGPVNPRYEPSEMESARRILKLSGVRPGELVADLGCGDGRIVVLAVRDFDARGLCIERDPILLADARANARLAGVADRIEFVEGDILDISFLDADVVTLYLSPQMNARLESHLRYQLRPGSRVVSLAHGMPTWLPSAVERFDVPGRGQWSLFRYEVGT